MRLRMVASEFDHANADAPRSVAYAVARALVLLHACCMLAAGYTVVHATPERIEMSLQAARVAYFACCADTFNTVIYRP